MKSHRSVGLHHHSLVDRQCFFEPRNDSVKTHNRRPGKRYTGVMREALSDVAVIAFLVLAALVVLLGLWIIGDRRRASAKDK
jgi:hypothetical protein